MYLGRQKRILILLTLAANKKLLMERTPEAHQIVPVTITIL